MRQSHKKGTQVECKLLRWLIKLPGSLQVSRGAIAQLGERIVRNDEVVGSIPTSSTMFSIACRPILDSFCPTLSQKSGLAAQSLPQTNLRRQRACVVDWFHSVFQ